MFVSETSLKLRQGSSKRQTRLLLFIGFGSLLLLMIVLGVSADSFMYRIELQESRIRVDYARRSRALENLRSNIYISGTYVRDFLLDMTDQSAAGHAAQFLNTRHEIESEIGDYQPLVTGEATYQFQQLRHDAGSYFEEVSPVLGWNSGMRRLHGYSFMQEHVLPHRTIVLGLAQRMQEIAEKEMERSSDSVAEMAASFRARLVTLMLVSVFSGIALAGLALWRLFRLENESQFRFQEVLKTREELKRLSAELVSAQETERRRISRELHDEIGQVLSAITLGLAGVRSALRDEKQEEAFRQLQLVQDMTERNVGVVRNISLLLRPTMLDDLGLLPALKWYAREVSRTSELTVDVVAESFPDDLPDEHRTCVFRVVQEAVRNAARHSGATQVRIYLRQHSETIRASVQDDGRGFDPVQEKGLGTVGMEERLTNLGGHLQVDSEPGRGTTVTFDLPLPQKIVSQKNSWTDSESDG